MSIPIPALRCVCISLEEDPMRFMIIIKNEPTSEDQMPPPEVFEAMGNYNQSLVDAGILLAAEGLTSSKDGAPRSWLLASGSSRSSPRKKRSSGPGAFRWAIAASWKSVASPRSAISKA